MPSAQRQLEADNRRVQDLRSIAAAISGMTVLPHSLSEAAASRPGLRMTDPVTGRAYEYTMKSTREYELCATFMAADDTLSRPYGTAFWSHPAGRACFAFEAQRPVPW